MLVHDSLGPYPWFFCGEHRVCPMLLAVSPGMAPQNADKKTEQWQLHGQSDNLLYRIKQLRYMLNKQYKFHTNIPTYVFLNKL